MTASESLLIAFCLVATFVVTPIALVMAPVVRGAPAVAVFPPWLERETVLANSGLVEISPVSAPFGALVDTQIMREPAVWRAQGIWFLLDGRLIARLCGEKNV